MSFGAPPSSGRFTPTPPERGSFPLDHYGDCKQAMEQYMACMRKGNSEISACRELSEAYLKCRMQHDLMLPDDMRNLGFDSSKKDSATNDNKSTA